MNRLSKRSAVEPYRAMDIMAGAFALEREGRRIVHMAVGEPGAPVPGPVREAAAAALSNGRIRYTEALGIPALRRRIAAYYGDAHGLDVSPDRIVVTTGSSAAFNLAFLSLFDVGDRVGVSTPGYPPYRNILQTLGLEIVDLPTEAETRWIVTPEMIAGAHSRKPLQGLILASPNNPNGTVIAPDDLRAIVDTCRELGIRLIMDEIYHGLVYGFPAKSALAFSDGVIVVNSFSKYYCMTGWRIGWMVVPAEMTRSLECLHQNLAISVNALSQQAAIAAFDATDELEAVKAGYAANRELLLRELPKAGLGDLHPVDGAFYVYANVHRFTNDSVDFARRLLVEAGVAVAPGIDFDPARGANYVRLSFAGTHSDMAEGADRIADFLSRTGAMG
ncbi:aminotransferase class I/II-fold pyridoxal phosphate-dependent enzyme [Bradyrhizobium sp. CIAT3101]|uniref:pyridoxal phosphate-dependent aminotransferase n=1 Tax=Bradyrhizobium sp. CIAT3101 TaxID=439387 RepID=UPI0024B0B475|nr:aminotransferase class I/II-fold pyridoxal phosphate-dependent enzyme [Bradyrhizobium sp. CIAT3101]WFU82484.1 aminotransferase class I/II-fold pyridoxal phosphate-dependent enzyme [Bradyrhizobium sp. CIAT3101]